MDWIGLREECPITSEKSVRMLLPFPTSYLGLYEMIRFSAVAVIKTKYRHRLNIEEEIRAAISTTEPRFLVHLF